MTKKFILVFLASVILSSCGDSMQDSSTTQSEQQEEFNYFVEDFADIKILRYQIQGWEDLTLKEQKLVYYLTEAGLAGRDIIWDQNYRHNLKIREALETIYAGYDGDRFSEDWKAFEIYMKRV